MAIDYSGAGDPGRTLELLWGKPPAAKKRGPKPTLTTAEVVRAAIEIADAEGLDACSMRRLAEACGLKTMSIYTYVPGRPELIDLMLDAVAAELGSDEAARAAGQPDGANTDPDPSDGSSASPASDDWRAGLERVARENYALGRRHPWMLQIATTRPPIGPGIMAKYERELTVLDGIGLTDLEIDATLTLVLSHAANAARSANDAALAPQRTGLTDEEWWRATAPFLDDIDWAAYPVGSRVGQASGEAHGAYQPDHGLTFGLATILDGIETLLRTRDGGV